MEEVRLREEENEATVHRATLESQQQPLEQQEADSSWVPVAFSHLQQLNMDTVKEKLWNAVELLKENKQLVALAAGPVAALLIVLCIDLDDGPHPESEQTQTQVTGMLATLAWMAIWWLTEAVPIAATALLPLSLLPLFGILDANKTASAYFNDTQALFLGSFILALAVERWNVHRRIALKMLLLAGKETMHPRKLLAVFCLCPGFLSMWISNTATAIMMVPMAVGVLHKVRASHKGSQTEHKVNRSGKDWPQVDQVVRAGDREEPHPSSGGLSPTHHKVIELTAVSSNPANLTEVVLDEPRHVKSEEHKTMKKGNATYHRLTGRSGKARGAAEGGSKGVVEEEDLDEDVELLDADILKYSKGVVLAIAFSASIGGIATLTGTGPNLILAGVFKSLFPEGPSITFMQWAIFGLPLGLIFLAFLWGLLCLRYCPTSAIPKLSRCLARSSIEEEYQQLGPMSFAEKAVIIDFVTMAVLWMTRSLGGFLKGWGYLLGNQNYVIDGTVSITMAIVLFMIPSGSGESGEMVMDWDTCHRLPWDIVLLMGGGFALSAGVSRSGFSSWIGDNLSGLSVFPYLLLTPVIATVVTFTTEFSSNAATATVFLPVLAHVAISIGRHPLMLMLPAAVACSFAFMLPVATPPNAIAYATGYLKMTDMAVPGLLLNFVGIGLLSVAVPTLGALAFGLHAPSSTLSWATFAVTNATTLSCTNGTQTFTCPLTTQCHAG